MQGPFHIRWHKAIDKFVEGFGPQLYIQLIYKGTLFFYAHDLNPDSYFETKKNQKKYNFHKIYIIQLISAYTEISKKKIAFISPWKVEKTPGPHRRIHVPKVCIYTYQLYIKLGIWVGLPMWPICLVAFVSRISTGMIEEFRSVKWNAAKWILMGETRWLFNCFGIQ